MKVNLGSVVFCVAVLSAPIMAIASDLPIIPRPAHLTVCEGVFRSGPELVVDADQATVQALRRAIAADGGPEISSLSVSKPRIVFTIVPDLMPDLGEEGYTLSVRADSVTARAAGSRGLLYAVQTLRQLAWAGGGQDEWILPCCEIKDRPRFAWRGFMLDESRNFSGADAVKRLLDEMGLLKLNRFHWHLTNDTAWRIEIDGWPRLTQTAPPTSADVSAGRLTPAFYTEQQVREIVAYAAERGIVIVPEINMPGHATAANRAYPEYSAGGSPQRPVATFNPADEGTFRYLESILRSVAKQFPDAGVLHIGGEEVSHGWQNWLELPEVKELMAKEGLKDRFGVERYFKRRMVSFVDSLGLRAGLWMSGTEQDVPSDQVVLFWWRHEIPGELWAALDRGYSVVLCPRVPCYFDFVQEPSHIIGARWAGNLLVNTLHSVYSFPDSLLGASSANDHILGVQANLWTEKAVMQERRDLLTFPRLYALAEAAWTPPESKDYAAFEERLRVHLPHLRAAGITPWDPFTKAPEVAPME